MAEAHGPQPNPFDLMSLEEKDKLIKARLFQTHKAHNSLSIFDQLYPENPPRVCERTGEVIRPR